jgi:hypothetical protein
LAIWPVAMLPAAPSRFLDNDLLSERYSAAGARHDVVAAAGGVGDDQRDGL